MDVITAFLYSKIIDVIYIEQSEGFNKNENKICKLNKIIYRLKQNLKVWYETISNYLKILSFESLESDYSIFINMETFIIIIIFAKSKKIINNLKKNLFNKFKITDLGSVHLYLNIEIKKDRINSHLEMNQKIYLNNILNKFGIQKSKNYNIPIEIDFILELYKE
jgi:N-glycosylase/DNA lyase